MGRGKEDLISPRREEGDAEAGVVVGQIIPVVGGLIAIVWWIVLAIQGVHRTTSGKATAAILIPVVVCCGGIVLIGLAVGAALLTPFGHTDLSQGEATLGRGRFRGSWHVR